MGSATYSYKVQFVYDNINFHVRFLLFTAFKQIQSSILQQQAFLWNVFNHFGIIIAKEKLCKQRNL